MILARFSASSDGNFGAAGNPCQVNLVVVKPGGIQEASGVTLDTDDTGDNYQETHMFEVTEGPP